MGQEDIRRAIAVEISTGGAEGDTAPSPAAVYVDQISFVSI